MAVCRSLALPLNTDKNEEVVCSSIFLGVNNIRSTHLLLSVVVGKISFERTPNALVINMAFHDNKSTGLLKFMWGRNNFMMPHVSAVRPRPSNSM